ncbi:dihydroorotase [Sesbania bispinosa]|nr:dihydroorotase [Sesbania bispinosa]
MQKNRGNGGRILPLKSLEENSLNSSKKFATPKFIQLQRHYRKQEPDKEPVNAVITTKTKGVNAARGLWS